ncbi:MAG: metallophosphoesterase [Alphaproteobacteria bacterium]|uniref:Metallophosphoesterase n=1 Tax=Candidatus Nitrobium versatile TaxID=2884831 RepID=A0A953J7N8_9BACT|nr:metallophosphoesterase [Candidatus Nitrobium versatile]
MMNRRQFLYTAVAAGLGLTGADSLFYETDFIEYTEHIIHRGEPGGPAVRLLQLSDLHLRDIEWHHEKLADRVNSLNPDFLLFTGDTIDREGNLRLLNDFLRLFKRDMVKLSILGNWERWAIQNIRELRKVYRENNCDLLINQTRTFEIQGKKMLITGVDDLVTGFPNFLKAIRNMPREKNHIVLAHSPKHRDALISDCGLLNSRVRGEEDRVEVDCVLSGHTHGGQVSFFGYAPILPKGSAGYVKGWFRDRKPYLYVSRGIGTSILPVRFGARAEVPMFTYHLR